MIRNRVCIIGGGNLGHVIAGMLSHRQYEVNILTSCPEKWNAELVVFDLQGRCFNGKLKTVSDDPSIGLEGVDLVLLCLPGNAIESALHQIKPYINDTMLIGSIVGSTGFFWMAKNILSQDAKLFAFQRVPYISRVINYGKSAELKGYKDRLAIGVSTNIDRGEIKNLFETMFETPIDILDSYLEVALTNSNPILHPARIYSVIRNRKVFRSIPYFYEDWDDDSSDILIEIDNEFRAIIKSLNVPSLLKLPSLLDYYNSIDSASLTQKIKSIEAFKNIKFPMVQVVEGFKPDYENRYFTEDIPYGLLIIKSIGDLMGVECKRITEIITLTQSRMNKDYLVDGELKGKDLLHSAIVQNYGIHSLESVMEI